MTHPSSPSLAHRILAQRHGGVFLFVGLFLVASLIIRLALLAQAATEIAWNGSLLAAFAWGWLFDLATAAWLSLPIAITLTLLPTRIFDRAWARWIAALAATTAFTLAVFDAVAEWVFWNEYGTRFNFIAVDYLVYTQEVLDNIRESYPMPLLLSLVAAIGAALTVALWRTGWPSTWFRASGDSLPRRLRAGVPLILGALVLGSSLDSTTLPAFANHYNNELAKNGLWWLVSAFKDNELDYDTFYTTNDIDAAFGQLRSELVEDGSILVDPAARDSLRLVSNELPALHPNVIQITVESLSADFLGLFNPESDLTPNLDALASDSLVFDRFYATGTRTDRGMEALTLSLPPTPGRSIIKRPGNEHLFTLGSVFRSRGYDTAFLYGGYGYFDNMNYFFGNNGYRLVDRGSVDAEDVSFANAWGACDGDLYNWTLREADEAAAKGDPFHFFVMTTSNHRPYTFPAGKIDMPSKTSGRAGAVKYTDFAIGEFLRQASTRPWYRDTVFVIVADHCASCAGRTEVPIERYHIPLLIFAPGGQIAPGRISTLTSQMDYAPTLLGLLNWSYSSRFFGHDVRRIAPEDAHALIGTYQALGHLERGEFVLLTPLRHMTAFTRGEQGWTDTGETPTVYGQNEAIAFYETASYMFQEGLYRELSATELAAGGYGGAATPPTLH